MKHSLRAIDAIHLAGALFLKSEEEERLVFATADARLAKAARAEGLDTGWEDVAKGGVQVRESAPAWLRVKRPGKAGKRGKT